MASLGASMPGAQSEDDTLSNEDLKPSTPQALPSSHCKHPPTACVHPCTHNSRHYNTTAQYVRIYQELLYLYLLRRPWRSFRSHLHGRQERELLRQRSP